MTDEENDVTKKDVVVKSAPRFHVQRELEDDFQERVLSTIKICRGQKNLQQRLECTKSVNSLLFIPIISATMECPFINQDKMKVNGKSCKIELGKFCTLSFA